MNLPSYLSMNPLSGTLFLASDRHKARAVQIFGTAAKRPRFPSMHARATALRCIMNTSHWTRRLQHESS